MISGLVNVLRCTLLSGLYKKSQGLFGFIMLFLFAYLYLCVGSISLPGEMDGITAGKTIKDRFNIPIIYMSGIYDEKVREEVGNPEPFEFLVKPMSKENVLKSVELGLQKFKP